MLNFKNQKLKANSVEHWPVISFVPVLAAQRPMRHSHSLPAAVGEPEWAERGWFHSAALTARRLLKRPWIWVLGFFYTVWLAANFLHEKGWALTCIGPTPTSSHQWLSSDLPTRLDPYSLISPTTVKGLFYNKSLTPYHSERSCFPHEPWRTDRLECDNRQKLANLGDCWAIWKLLCRIQIFNTMLKLNILRNESQENGCC